MTEKHGNQWWWCLGALWRRLRAHPDQNSPSRGYLAVMVDGRDGWEHLVTVEAYEQGLRDHTGFFMVLCGRRIPVASMTAPPKHGCFPCHELGGRA